MRALVWPATRRAGLGLLAAGVLAVMPAGAAAEGAVICVPVDIAGAGCTEIEPGTVQAAVDRAQALAGADTVRIASGTYGKVRQFDFIPSPAFRTTIRGAGQGETILTGATGGDPIAEFNGAVTLADVTIRDTSTTRATARFTGAEVRTERVTIENAAAANNQTMVSAELVDTTITHGGTGYALQLIQAAVLRTSITSTSAGVSYPVWLEQSRIVNSSIRKTAAAPYPDSGGITAYGPANMVAGTTVSVVGPTAVALDAATAGSNTAVTVLDSSFGQFTPGATAPAMRARSSLAGQGATITASGIAARGFAGLACAGTGVAGASAATNVSYAVAPSTAVSGCAGSLAGASAGGSAITLADPGFIDAAAGNFRTAQASPVVDAGSAAAPPPGLPDVDLYGNPRRSDGNGDGVSQLDIGASEWTPAPVVPGPADPGAGGGTPPGPPVSILPVPTVTFTALRRQGSVTRVSTKGKAAFKLLAKKPKKLKRGTALITTTVSLAGVRFTATLERRRPKQGKRKAKYVAVKGTETIAVAKRILRLQPTGRWRGKPLKTGRYRLKLTSPSGFTRRTTFSVVPRKR